MSRLAATAVAMVLCPVDLLIWPFRPVGSAVLLALGSSTVQLADRPGDAGTAAITIAIVLVAAELAPDNARKQPLLRLLNTIIGVVVGFAAAMLAVTLVRYCCASAESRCGRKRVRRNAKATSAITAIMPAPVH